MIQRTITKAYLIRHRNNRLELADEKARLNEINENKGGLTSPQITGMPHGSGTSDPVCDEAINATDLQAYVYELSGMIEEENCFIEKHIRRLDEPKQKQVIRLRYISCMDWDDVLFNMFGDNRNFIDNYDSYKRRMFALHRKAIDNLRDLTK